MNRVSKTSCVFLSSCFFITAPTNIYARFNENGFEKNNSFQTNCSTKITEEDFKYLLEDISPEGLKELAEKPELKKLYVQNIKQLFALACQVTKENLINQNIQQELKNTEIELTAVNYDRQLNKGLNQTQPFSKISESQVSEFYAETTNLSDFEVFLKTKIQLARDSGQTLSMAVITGEQLKQAKDYFAKTRIYYRDAQNKSTKLPKDFWDKLNTLIKLQKAQLLSSLYSKVLQEKTKVSAKEVSDYIAKHPELDPTTKALKAYEILRSVEAGGNFAALAKEFSDDPGSKNKGGLYRNVFAGQFMPEFEQAALSLKPGQTYHNLVETRYGYHIIKLVRKREIEDVDGKLKANYDVRHILISTAINDPNDPLLSGTSAKEYAEKKIEKEKQEKILADILINNPVEVVEDFEIPQISEEMAQKPEINVVPPSSVGHGEAGSAALNISRLRQSQNSRITPTILPAKIKNYLNSNYRGWKLSPTTKDCADAANNGVVEGYFNADRSADYAVKFTRRQKGFIFAFVSQNQNYKPFVLHNDRAEDINSLNLGTWKKGELFGVGKKSVRLKYDAPSDYRCESDVGGIHYYQNGKFAAY